jgi:hypothetical protein
MVDPAISELEALERQLLGHASRHGPNAVKNSGNHGCHRSAVCHSSLSQQSVTAVCSLLQQSITIFCYNSLLQLTTVCYNSLLQQSVTTVCHSSLPHLTDLVVVVLVRKHFHYKALPAMGWLEVVVKRWTELQVNKSPFNDSVGSTKVQQVVARRLDHPCAGRDGSALP